MFVLYAITDRVFGIYLLQDSKLKTIGYRGTHFKYKSVGYTAALDLIFAIAVIPKGELIGC